jgi:formylglycine-generating enzyme
LRGPLLSSEGASPAPERGGPRCWASYWFRRGDEVKAASRLTLALCSLSALATWPACRGSVSASADGGAESGQGDDSGCEAPVEDGALVPPSCAPGGAGMTNCGPCESCCTSLGVVGGTYYRTYANAGSDPTGEAAPASVSSFRLDKYEVTVGRFRQFVNAWQGAGYVPPAGSGKHTHLNGGLGLANAASPGTYEPGWVASDNSQIAPTDDNLGGNPSTWAPSAGANEALPIGNVNWWEAYAFCIWDGGFLPSEAEWEYAAAGGSEQREYPWGSADPGTNNQYAIFGGYYPGDGGLTPTYNIAPVGTATDGVGAWSQMDLAGNVWEWALDWLPNEDGDFYPDPSTDAAYLNPTPFRVDRGAGSMNSLSQLVPTFREGGPPASRAVDLGIRCARVP